MNGQTLTATTVDIYPTHLRLNLKDHEKNTAWLKSLDFYLVNEDGKRFEKIGNGVTATGSVDSPMMASYRLESSFFTVSKHLTIFIEGATWLDKDMEQIPVDLIATHAIALPEGVTFDEAKKVGNDWYLTFSAPKLEGQAMYQLFDTNYYDETGKEYQFNSWSSSDGGGWDEETQTYQNSDRFEITFALRDYPYDVVYLSPSYSRIEVLNDPITIKLK